MKRFYQWQGKDLILSVRVQPKASKDEVVGEQEGALKIRITAPPVDGKANKQLIGFLSRIFRIPKSNIVLMSGESARIKRLRIHAPKVLPDIIKPEQVNKGSTDQNRSP